MIVVDVNLLIYAVNEDAALHERAKAWWESSLSSQTPVGLPWSVLLGFVRLTTNPRVMPKPITPSQAFAYVDDWLAQPIVSVVDATDHHWATFKELLAPLGTAGNLTTDAHLAALAIEHGARLYSTDNDFGRFKGLRWTNPL